jgi:Ca-activated chloride channel family protein
MNRFSFTALLTVPLLTLFAQVQIPVRSATSLFKGEPGRQRTAIRFDPASGLVTLKLLVQDSDGYFIPNIRREDFVVYENDVPQTNAKVHFPTMNRMIATDVTMAGRQLLEVIGRDDKVAIWKYADRPELLADFTQDHQKLENLLYSLDPPGISEANLYDALTVVSQRMQEVRGPKAVILLSSGVDTFSKARLEDVLTILRTLGTTIYVVSLGEIFRQSVPLPEAVPPSANFDWKRAAQELQEIARASGGRFYAPPSTVGLSGVYDDIMENLKVRYVITYKSSTSGSPNSPRSVRVELVNPKTGGPLQVTDESGRTIQAHVVLQDKYVPASATGE